MSERKYNIKKNNENTSDFFNGYYTEAEGVETDKRPAWLKYAAGAAAALIITGGIAASTMKLMKNRTVVPGVQAGSDAAASAVISNTGTTGITTAPLETSAAVAVIETTAASTAQEVQSVQPATAPTAASTPVQQPQNTAAPVNTLTEDQCYDIINMATDNSITYEEILQVPCSDYLDFSDTFTATARVTHDTFSEGHPILDVPDEFTVKFVHYTDLRFNTISELKCFVDDYNNCWNGGNGPDTDILFGQSIVPGQVITVDLYNPEQIYVYTVYNGKIYRGISDDLDPERLQSHADFYTGERMALRWGHDTIRNITSNSFEDYRIQEDGNCGYYGRYRYYYYDGVQWRKDVSRERELSDAECRELMGF